MNIFNPFYWLLHYVSQVDPSSYHRVFPSLKPIYLRRKERENIVDIDLILCATLQGNGG